MPGPSPEDIAKTVPEKIINKFNGIALNRITWRCEDSDNRRYIFGGACHEHDNAAQAGAWDRPSRNEADAVEEKENARAYQPGNPSEKPAGATPRKPRTPDEDGNEKKTFDLAAYYVTLADEFQNFLTSILNFCSA